MGGLPPLQVEHPSTRPTSKYINNRTTTTSPEGPGWKTIPRYSSTTVVPTERSRLLLCRLLSPLPSTVYLARLPSVLFPFVIAFAASAAIDTDSPLDYSRSSAISACTLKDARCKTRQRSRELPPNTCLLLPSRTVQEGSMMCNITAVVVTCRVSVGLE